MPVIPENYQTLSAMITPALFLTANGSLIISTSNRLARIADRVRVLCETIDRLDRAPGDLDFVPDRIGLAEEQLGRLARRNEHIRVALTLLYLALASFSATSLSLAADVLLANRIAILPTALALAGVVLMMAACVRLSREAIAALKGEDREVRFCRDLHARRQGAAAERATRE